MSTQLSLKILDRRRFLIAAMQELAGKANISFEGNLASTKLVQLRGATDQETPALKRNTLWPKQGFVVIPLEADLIPEIISAIGGTIPKTILLHIQIEKQGTLQLGIYDNFQHIAYGEALSTQFFEQLQSEKIVKSPTTTDPTNYLTS